MSDSELKLVLITALQSLISSGKISPPVSSSYLLNRVISSRAQSTSSSNHASLPRFKLTDLSRFESILEDLSRTWDAGSILLSRDRGTLNIVEVSFNPPGSEARNPKKRKRVVDEDADSAAGDDNTEDLDYFNELQPSGALSMMPRGLNDELKEVYAILRKGTAKGRLLAEQVCLL
jgi:mRNA (2'-O-methyladenosine-N6-)-methyltransferase